MKQNVKEVRRKQESTGKEVAKKTAKESGPEKGGETVVNSQG